VTQDWNPARRRFLRAAAGVTALALIPGALTYARRGIDGMTPREVAYGSSLVDKVTGWTADSEMILRGKRGTPRTRLGRVRNLLRDNGVDSLRLFRFDAPSDLRGTALLIHENQNGDDDIWLYLPAIGRSRRIVSSARKDAFVGSEFSYADLMTLPVDRFTYEFGGHEVIEGHSCVAVISTPVDEGWARDIGYSRQVAWTDECNLAARRVEYHNLRGDHFKTQWLSNFHSAGRGKYIATHRRMVNHSNERETILKFEQLDSNADVTSNEFMPQRLDRG